MELLPNEILWNILECSPCVEVLMFSWVSHKMRLVTHDFVRKLIKCMREWGAEANLDYRLEHDTLYSLLQWPPVPIVSIDETLIRRLGCYGIGPLYYRLATRIANRDPKWHAQAVLILLEAVRYRVQCLQTSLTGLCWGLCELAAFHRLPYATKNGYLTRVIAVKPGDIISAEHRHLEEKIFITAGRHFDLRQPDEDEAIEFIVWLIGPEHEERVRANCKRFLASLRNF